MRQRLETAAQPPVESLVASRTVLVASQTTKEQSRQLTPRLRRRRPQVVPKANVWEQDARPAAGRAEAFARTRVASVVPALTEIFARTGAGAPETENCGRMHRTTPLRLPTAERTLFRRRDTALRCGRIPLPAIRP